MSAVARLEAGELHLGGERVPLLSGEMHFWRLDPRDWENCLRRIKDMGFPIVATYLSWRRHSLGPGRTDLAGSTDPRLDVTRFLQMCAEIGLWVHLKPGPWICAEETNGGYPDWLVGDPDLQALDSEGRAVLGYNSPFQSPIPSYLHPKYLDHVREWLMDVDECVRPFFYPRGPIIMVQLDNEPCMTFHDRMLESDYNPVNVGPGGYYQRWLQDKYGTIEALNTAYRSEWSSYDDVEPPRKVPTLKLDQLRQLTDWIEFKEWLLATHIELLRDFHLQNGLRGVLFTVNYNRHDQLSVPNNWSRLEKASGLGGFDYYPAMPMGFRELVDVSMAVNYGLSTLKASWSPEMMSGIWKFPTADVSSPGLRAEDFEYLYLTALAFGLKGMNFYMLVNRENWESAPLDERGQLTETAPAVQKVLELFRRVPDFTTLHKAQQVAIVYYRPYAWEAFAVDGQVVEDACCRMAESYARFEALYTALVRLNWDPAIFDPWVNSREHLAKYRMVFVPSGACMDRSTQQLLCDYADNGGTLVFFSEPPQSDLETAPWSLFGSSLTADGKAGGGEILCLGPVSGDALERGAEPNLIDLQRILGETDLSAESETDDSNVLTVVQRNDTTAVLFVLNTSALPSEPTIRVKGVQSGALVSAFSEEVASVIENGCARVSIPGNTVRVYFIRSHG